MRPEERGQRREAKEKGNYSRSFPLVFLSKGMAASGQTVRRSALRELQD